MSCTAASGSGLIIVTQPASGPGVSPRARCSTCSNPCVQSSPTRAPRPWSTALVATVVPCVTDTMSSAESPYWASMAPRPSTTAREGSSGVEGALNSRASPLCSSTMRKSVNVPPTSTPIRYATLGPPDDGGSQHRRAAARRIPGVEHVPGHAHVVSPALDQDRRVVLLLVKRRHAVLDEDVVVVVIRRVSERRLDASRRLLADEDDRLDPTERRSRLRFVPRNALERCLVTTSSSASGATSSQISAPQLPSRQKSSVRTISPFARIQEGESLAPLSMVTVWMWTTGTSSARASAMNSRSAAGSDTSPTCRGPSGNFAGRVDHVALHVDHDNGAAPRVEHFVQRLADELAMNLFHHASRSTTAGGLTTPARSGRNLEQHSKKCKRRPRSGD